MAHHAARNIHLAICAIVAALCATSSLAGPQDGTPILRSVPGDKGKYFLLEASRKGDVVYALSKRIGVEYTTYTRTETNCKTRLMREIGSSDVSPQQIKNNPTKWFDLVQGSSKSDLAHFVCKW